MMIKLQTTVQILIAPDWYSVDWKCTNRPFTARRKSSHWYDALSFFRPRIKYCNLMTLQALLV